MDTSDEIVQSCDRHNRQWRSATHEESTVSVKELDMFLTMKVLEDTPAVLSFGWICDENGYSYKWLNVQKNLISCKTGFGYKATRIISFLSWFQACQRGLPQVLSHLSTSLILWRQEIHHLTFSSRSSTSPTTATSSASQRKIWSTWKWYFSSVCVKLQCLMVERGSLLLTVNHITGKVTKPTENSHKNFERRPYRMVKPVVCRFRSRYREALTPVHLMELL